MSTNDFYKKLVNPIRDPKISQIIEWLSPDEYSPHDEHLTYAERLEPIKTLRETFIQWSKSWIYNLEKFPFVYVMNGNTDSINTLFSTSKGVMSWKKGDYSYYQYWHKQIRKPFKELIEPEKVDDIILSWPGYTWGNTEQLEFANSCNAQRMHLDCAYLGLVKPLCIDVAKFETVSVSFSKTLSIPYNRIGLLFSKTEISPLSIMNSLGYVNLSGVKIATRIMEQLPVDYWWENYADKLEHICKVNDIRKTDCLLFGYINDNRISLAEYWKQHL